MSDEPQSAPARPAPDTAFTAQTQPRRSCLSRIGRFFAAVLLLLLAVGLSIATIGAIAFFVFGFTLETPSQIVRLSSDLPALRATNTALQAQVATLQTQAAELAARESSNREVITVLEQQLDEIEQLGDDLREQATLAATIQAGARDDRVTVAVVATTQAERVEQLAQLDTSVNELQNRTERIIRFIQRLNDISGDAALDLEPAEAGRTPLADTITPASPTFEPESPTSTTTPAATATARATATATASPAPPPPTATPPTATPEAQIYTVQPGDTLRSIAEQFDVTIQALLAANNLTPEQADALQPGQELIIP